MRDRSAGGCRRCCCIVCFGWRVYLASGLGTAFGELHYRCTRSQSARFAPAGNMYLLSWDSRNPKADTSSLQDSRDGLTLPDLPSPCLLRTSNLRITPVTIPPYYYIAVHHPSLIILHCCKYNIYTSRCWAWLMTCDTVNIPSSDKTPITVSLARSLSSQLGKSHQSSGAASRKISCIDIGQIAAQNVHNPRHFTTIITITIARTTRNPRLPPRHASALEHNRIRHRTKRERTQRHYRNLSRSARSRLD